MGFSIRHKYSGKNKFHNPITPSSLQTHLNTKYYFIEYWNIAIFLCNKKGKNSLLLNAKAKCFENLSCNQSKKLLNKGNILDQKKKSSI